MMDYDKLMDIAELDVNAVCFGILCNFPQFCGDERAKEAAELVRALYAERENLRADLARVTAERDGAIADLYYTGGCPTCKLNRGKSDRTGIPICTKKIEYPTGECYEWRGIKED